MRLNNRFDSKFLLQLVINLSELAFVTSPPVKSTIFLLMARYRISTIIGIE